MDNVVSPAQLDDILIEEAYPIDSVIIYPSTRYAQKD